MLSTPRPPAGMAPRWRGRPKKSRPVKYSANSRMSLADVVGEVGLAELAVVDAVDAALDLLAHDVRDALAQAAGEGLLIVGRAAGAGGDERRQVVGAGGAGGVGGQDALRASLHSFPSSTSSGQASSTR